MIWHTCMLDMLLNFNGATLSGLNWATLSGTKVGRNPKCLLPVPWNSFSCVLPKSGVFNNLTMMTLRTGEINLICKDLISPRNLLGLITE